MVNKEVKLLFGEEVRRKVEELLDMSLSDSEVIKSFSTTPKDMLEQKLQEASVVRKDIQDENFRNKVITTITNHILGMVAALYKAEEDKEINVRRRVIQYTAIDSLNSSEIAMQAIAAHWELKNAEKEKAK